MPRKALVVWTGSNVVAASGGQLFRYDGALVPTTGSIPGPGPLRGMATWGGKLYVFAGTCHYEIDPATFAYTTLGCVP
jgi:hypothetical protein